MSVAIGDHADQAVTLAHRHNTGIKLGHQPSAGTGQILASELTTHDVDDSSQVEPLLDQIPIPLASLICDGAYDQAGIYDAVARRHPEADVIVPPRSTTVPSDMAESAPTQIGISKASPSMDASAGRRGLGTLDERWWRLLSAG